MLGLIKKDLLLLKTNTKIFIGIFIFYIIFGVASDFEPSVVTAMIAMVMGMQVLSTIQWDEQFKWNPYALTMPLSRKSLVISKYILSAITIGTGTFIGLICTLATAAVKRLVSISNEDIFTAEIFITALVVFGIILFINALLLPAIFKFGAEKARILLIVFIGLPIFIIAAIVEYILNPSIPKPAFINTFIAWCSEHLLEVLPIIAVVFLIAAVAVSCMISIKIFEKKEF